MGIGFSCFGQPSSRRLADDEHDMKHDDRRGSSFTMLGCLGSKETKKRQHQQQQQKQPKKAKKELTLEEWLIDSSSSSSLTTTTGLQKNIGSSGEYHVFKHYSKRVFPSFVGDNITNSNNNANNINPRQLKAEDGFEREVKEMEITTDEVVSLSRSQSLSGKSKKKVSFKLPDEADIFIFHPSSGEE